MSPKVGLNEGIVGKTLSDIRNAAVKKSKALLTKQAESAPPRGRRAILVPNTNTLERVPKTDTVSKVTTAKTLNTSKSAEAAKNEAKPNTLGAAFEASFINFRDQLFKDVQEVCQSLPGWTFVAEYSKPNSIKRVNSTLDKIVKREEKFKEFGLNSTVRDFVRLTVFRPDAEKINPLTNRPNYMDFFEAMENIGKKKRGGAYKIALTEKEANGCVVFDSKGNPVMVPDIDVRKGDNRVPSGYGDIQARLTQKGKLAEIIILPGMNYATTKNLEHKLVFEKFRLYDNALFPKSEGAKGIIKELRKTYNQLTRQLYDDADMRDAKGMGEGKVITFTKEQVKKINSLFEDLKSLYYSRFRANNKAHVSMLSEADARKEFESTAVFVRLDSAEQGLREVLELYKPLNK